MVRFIRISAYLVFTLSSGIQKELEMQTMVASGNFTIEIHICTEEQGCVIPQSAAWILVHVIPKMAACVQALATYRASNTSTAIHSISNTAFE